MAAIVFHETAHLLGVAHEPTQMPILVANCDCSQQEINDRKCLQIPYDQYFIKFHIRNKSNTFVE